MDRRDFLKKTGAAAAAFAALPYIGVSWADVPSRKGKFVEGRKLKIACIGLGGKGNSDTKAAAKHGEIVAVCDVDQKRAGSNWERVPEARRYRDFRRMLMECDDEIDAVTVSTPDHMHFPISMMAITMGKHVFCQKPLTHTIEEARVLTLAAREHGVATQMGIQGHSFDGIHLMRQWMGVQAIGEVTELVYWTNRPIWPQGITEPLPATPVPGHLDWNLWQGVAKERAYNKDYMPFNWRGWWDYGCGALGDIGCHSLDCAFDVLKLGSPSSIEAESSGINEQTAPKSSKLVYHFPGTADRGPIKLTWYDGVKDPNEEGKPPRPAELEEGRKLPGAIGGQLWCGTEGKIMTSDVYCRSPRIIPEAKMKEFQKNKMPPKKLREQIKNFEEWIRACQGAEPAGANFDYAGPLTEMVLLGNLAIRSGKKIEWDAEKMVCTNVPEANQYLRKQYRVF